VHSDGHCCTSKLTRVWCPIYSLQKKDRGILASGKAKTAAIPVGIARIFNAAKRQKTRDVCDE
jgi:hypothetical protein